MPVDMKEMMAEAVSEGAKNAGADVSLLNVSETNAAEAASFDVLALGCPAMGGEVLEEMEFEPFFTELESKLSGKKVALAGAEIISGEGLILNETPDESGLEQCRELGKQLA